ncbi:polysaccharide pyruvyl transferase family protein [Hoylesella nanceiensis]|jgi:possible xanthan biosynthesis pyruvyltransferase|uniref:polysaccharide pyruvyl transferase family protein n=1 Tax=Hoylesella nanceiensis TaxID=425941 RepID=UPI001CAFD993|nr:polysaccharide pyruvyl transferase family protein [Hoylesella nanceiensis]MBF1420548.1 polysaccharide pyruvyl transferase family protein [Hoylesella nanceiensis]
MKIIKKIWQQIRCSYLYWCRNALLINAYVDDDTWTGIRHSNWGDDLNYYFISHLTKRPIVFLHRFWLAKKLNFRNYLCIGTLMDAVNYSRESTIVWGTGVSGQDRLFTIPKEIRSVRGKKSIEFLQQKNMPYPALVGDPALILPLFYQPKNKEKKYKLGIIPHVIDLEHPIIKQIQSENSNEVLIINLSKFEKWTDIIDQICSCESIASSSLHGLITSDTYGVPNCWIELSGKISGGHFKFYDYASSVNRTFNGPITMHTNINQIIEECKQWTQPTINHGDILKSCPFNIKAEQVISQ